MGYAQQLARRGFHIFPCQVNGKKPLAGIKWRKESTTDKDIITAWEKKHRGCNWGIDCGKSGLAVLDIDVKKENGFETLQKLAVNKGFTTPDTMVFDTPTGGRHIVFRGSVKTTAGVLGPGLDTRGVGGYIVAPGSSIGGVKYKVRVNRTIADAPKWLQVVSDPKPAVIKTNKTDIETDLPHNVEDCVHYLTSRAPPAIEGQGGDTQTFQIICHVRDYGISEQRAWELLMEHWNDSCEPPWELSELRAKVTNAYMYAQNSPGAKTAQAAFDAPVESAFKAPETSSVEILPMMDLTEALAPAPPQEWLLDGWIPSKEMCLFTGKEGTGKSLLALQLALSAAYGIPWLGKELDREYQVIYISCEDDKSEIQRRCNAIARLPEYAFLSGAVDPSRFRPVPLVGEDNAMVYEDNWKLEAGPIYLRLNATLNYLGWKNPLLIFDTLSDMFMANENNRAMVQHFVKRYLGRFRRDYDATIITLAHPPKSEAEYSGSTAWPAAHRSCIGVKANPSKSLPNHRIIELWKGNRTTLRGKQINVEWRAGAFHPVNISELPEAEQLAAAENMNIIYAYIEEYAENDTMQALSISPQAVNFIGKAHIPIRDIDGALMSVDTKKEYVNLLREQGRVEIVTGQSSRGNGIFPVKMEDVLS